MNHPVNITFRNMKPSAAVTAHIEAEAAKLERYYDRITSCHVLVETPHRPHRSGKKFRVRIELEVPRTELVVDHEPSLHAALARSLDGRLKKQDETQPDHKDLNVVIRDVFRSARRQLQDYARRLRGNVKTHPESQALRAEPV